MAFWVGYRASVRVDRQTLPYVPVAGDTALHKRSFNLLYDLIGDGCEVHRHPNYDLYRLATVCEAVLLRNANLAQFDWTWAT